MLLAGVGLLALYLAALRPHVSAPGSQPSAVSSHPGASHAPRRIVSLAPGATEILFALGLGDRLVGVTNACDYPPEAKKKPRVGLYERPSLEAIVALEPDLVVAESPFQDEVIVALRGLGVTAMGLCSPDFDAVTDSIRLLGTRTGTQEQAQSLAGGMQAQWRRVRRQTAALPAQAKPAVFVVIGGHPLITAGPGTFIHELIEAAGGRNIAGKGMSGYPLFSPERVAAEKPEVVIVTHESALTAIPEAWRGGRVYTPADIDPDAFCRPGPRLAEALETLLRLLHPDLCEARTPCPGPGS